MTPLLAGQLAVVGSRGVDLDGMLTAAGLRPAKLAVAELAALATPSAQPPKVLVVDLRGEKQFPVALPELKRAHPKTAIVLVVGALETSLMLEAIRCGVTECMVEPVAPAEFVAAVRRLGDRSAPTVTGEVFGVIGAKGGVGTTTVAVNLAAELARIAPGQTVLVDLHLSHGDAAVMFGAEPRFTVVDALQNAHRLDEAVFRGLVTPTSAGVDLLASSGKAPEMAALDGVPQLVAFAASLYRYVVLDLPRAGSGPLEALADLSRLVIITNQELSTIRHTTSLVAALQRRFRSDRVSVLVSRFDPNSDIRRQDIERVVKVPITHTVPSDYRLAVRAQNMGRPLTLDNHSPLAATFRTLSRDLAGIKTPVAAAAGTSLFGRLSGRRS